MIGIGSVGVGAPFVSITDDASSGRAPSLSLAPLADLDDPAAEGGVQ